MWLDSKPSVVLSTFGIAYGSGAPYDVSVAGLLDRRRSRYEQWHQLVREQMAGIAEHCRAAGHVSTPAVARVEQIELFELAAGPSGGAS